MASDVSSLNPAGARVKISDTASSAAFNSLDVFEAGIAISVVATNRFSLSVSRVTVGGKSSG
jgi:hypothetical protein